MQKPPLDPDVADIAPTDPTLTAYDQQHLVTYLRLLDADAESADWREVAKIDQAHELDRCAAGYLASKAVHSAGWTNVNSRYLAIERSISGKERLDFKPSSMDPLAQAPRRRQRARLVGDKL